MYIATVPHVFILMWWF